MIIRPYAWLTRTAQTLFPIVSALATLTMILARPAICDALTCKDVETVGRECR